MMRHAASAWHTSITELRRGSRNRFSVYCSGSVFHSVFLQGAEGIHIFIQSLYCVQQDSGRQTRKAVYKAAEPEEARWDLVPAPPGKTNIWPQRQHATQLNSTRFPLKCVSIPLLPAGLVLWEEWEEEEEEEEGGGGKRRKRGRRRSEKRGRAGRVVVGTAYYDSMQM